MSMNESKFRKNPFLQHLGEKFLPYLLHYQLWNTPCCRIASHKCHNPTSSKTVVSDFIRALQREKQEKISSAPEPTSLTRSGLGFACLWTPDVRFSSTPNMLAYTLLQARTGSASSLLLAAWLNPGTGSPQSISELQSSCPKAYALDTGQLSSFLIIESLPERAVTGTSYLAKYTVNSSGLQ